MEDNESVKVHRIYKPIDKLNARKMGKWEEDLEEK